MNFITKIFKASDLVKEVGNVADELITSQEEKLILKKELEEKILEHEESMQSEITERWKEDMN